MPDTEQRTPVTSPHAGPRFQNRLSIGIRRRVLVEQAIARGWSKRHTCTELGVTEVEYDAVRRAMDRACERAW